MTINDRPMKTRYVSGFQPMVFVVMLLACVAAHGQTKLATNIQISDAVQQASVHRLGVNLGDETYFDSGQIMKNLIFNNPGFEGLRYRMIYKCKKVTANTCQDDNQYAAMATNYWVGGTYRVLSGTQAGVQGTIAASIASSNCSGCGQTVQFDKSIALATADYIAVTQYTAGGGDAGWGVSTSGGATVTTELNDLSPNTPGKQAMLLSAVGPGQSAGLTQGFDTWSNLSFIQLNGNFEVTFRAKGKGGNNQMNVTTRRLQPGLNAWQSQTLTLTNSWQDYTLTFSANETGSGVGPVQLSFTAVGSNVELDDVSLDQTNSDPSNTTVFRDDVVNTLKALNPGTIRMMAAGAALGSDIPNQLQVPLARYRMGFNSSGKMPRVSFGIHEFLQLCQTVGSDPWITIPTATTPAEMAVFIQYLTGSGSDQWSSLRIARGQNAPWTSVFKKIHVELGNETWNGSFKGESMNYPGYPQWANTVFAAARTTSGFKAANFDLVIDGWASSSGYTTTMLSTSNQHDSVDIAPYLLYSANDESQSLMFGALLAEPEMWGLPGGQVFNSVKAAAAAPSATSSTTALSVYETNLGTMIGNVTKPQLDALTPSIGAGLAHTVHMLEMMRVGVQYQNAFSLTQYEYKRGDQSLVRLWGLVVDMGTTGRRRPEFLTQAMANTAIAGDMLQTIHTGANPTWNQPLSSDGVVLNGAHDLQSFAFKNGNTTSTVVFNLSQTVSVPVTFSGANAPSGTVQQTQITSASITDNNEFADVVKPVSQSLSGFNPAVPMSLPPFSMTVLTSSSTAAEATQTPSFSVPAGTYSTTQTVSLASATATASIYYTTDGSTPTKGSAKYAGPIVVSKTQMVSAIATSANLTTSSVGQANYTIQSGMSVPVFSPAAGTYSSGQTVAISDAVAGATIYYTTDGSTPTTASTIYSGPVLVNATETLKAIAAASNYTTSGAATAVYTISTSTATPAPVFSVPAGTYHSTQYVKISDAMSSAIYCTTDGTTPTVKSKSCSSGATVSTTQKLQAIAVSAGHAASAVTTATYTIAPYAAMPVLSVIGSTYNTPQTVTITDPTSGAKIYYSVDQSKPSIPYTGPISVTGVTYLQALAVAPGYTQSFISTANYVMTVGTPTLSTSGSTLAISDVTPGAAIFYTTNGSTPTSTSTQYLGPIAFNGTTVVKAIGVKRDYVNSAIGYK